MNYTTIRYIYSLVILTVPMRPADLQQQGRSFRNQVLNLCRPASPNGTATCESGSIEALRELVRRRYGYTLLPELNVAGRGRN